MNTILEQTTRELFLVLNGKKNINIKHDNDELTFSSDLEINDLSQRISRLTKVKFKEIYGPFGDYRVYHGGPFELSMTDFKNRTHGTIRLINKGNK